MADIIRELKYYTGPSTCKNYGAIADLKVDSEKGNTYMRAVAHKDIIKTILKGEATIADISDFVDQGIESMYSLDATNEEMKRKEAKLLNRYLSQEKRKPVFAARECVDIDYENIGIIASPDLLFVDKANKVIEAVLYRSGTPTINQKTYIKPEKIDNVKEWFKLWVLEKYCKGYAEKNLSLKDGDVYECKASYYFMKKTTDNKVVPDNDFFSGQGGNIVTFSNKYVYGAPTTPTEDDLIFRKFIDDSDAGLDCTDKDCDSCMGKANCKYTKAPIKAVRKAVAKRAEIVYSNSQLAVINAVDGVYKVNATAGSGKTECMTERSARLIADGVNPKNILHISFTDAAVGEMKERIVGKCLARDIDCGVNDIECYTFNAFANKAIGKYYKELGFTKAPAILSAEYELETIENLINDSPITGIDAGSVQYNSNGGAIETAILIAQKTFGVIKSLRIDVDNDPDAIDDIIAALREVGYYKKMSDQSIYDLLEMYKEYDRILKEDNFVTYADQEPLMFKVLELHPEYFDNLGYEHIIVDEFQDSNEIQIETIRKLMKTDSFKSLMVVGDDSQAIYAFRDTTPEFIINFDKYIDLPVTELFLTENRRSTPEIIGLSNAVNNLNTNKVDKDMIATRDNGSKPFIQGFYSKAEEYKYISESIIKKVNEGADPKSICFIASKKTELQEMGTLLTKAGIPWVMKNPMDLMENSRVIGALSIADAFYQPEATILYFNYLAARYDGEILNTFTIDEINDMIADMMAEFETIYLRPMEEQKAIFHRYLEAIRETVSDELYDYFLSLVYNNEDLPSELEYTRIFKKYGSKMAKKMDQNYEGVVLTTAHSSKGLEWPIVFLSISNFDSEQLHKSRNLAQLEEKRRLLFVSTTRARDELYVTGEYVAYGPKDNRTYNQFLHELYVVSGNEKLYQPVDPMEAIRDAEKREKARERQRERYAEKKAAKTIDSILGANTTKGGEMSDADKKAYNKLVKGSSQMTLKLTS